MTGAEQGSFVIMLKRLTLFATTSGCVFMLYAVLDLATDSFSVQLQEEVTWRFWMG